MTMAHEIDLEIPPFLRRKRGEGPAPVAAPPPEQPPAAKPEPLPRDPRWLAIEEHEQRKKRMSWEKRKGVLSDAEAKAQGKVWDPIHGGWKTP